MGFLAKSPNLKKRALTNLYNERPTWLKLAHEKLDRAVLAAYALIDPAGHWSEGWATLYTATGATPLPPDHPRHADRLANSPPTPSPPTTPAPSPPARTTWHQKSLK